MKPIGPLTGDSLAERVRVVVEVAAEHAEVVDREGRFPSEAVQAMRDSRLLALTAPPHLNGEGAGLGEVADICVALGQVCASSAMVFAMHHISLANLLDCGVDSAWHRDFIGRAASEQLLFASSTTEAGVGGDLRQSICAVEPDGDTFSLGKTAPVISYGEQADAIFATARRDPDAPSSDQVLCVLLKDQYQLERLSTWDALGMRGTCSHGFRLTARAPTAQILPRPFADIAAESMVAASHILWSSVWCGVAADALAKAQACVVAEARKSVSAPPSASRLAETYTRFRTLEATLQDGLARWSALRAEPSGSATLGFSLAMNALKVSVSTLALQVVDDALMICGLPAYKNSGPYALGRQLRDIHSARLMIGNDRILNGAGQMLLMQRQPLTRRS
jgi:acyl-CoA dehydrogenase